MVEETYQVTALLKNFSATKSNFYIGNLNVRFEFIIDESFYLHQSLTMSFFGSRIFFKIVLLVILFVLKLVV